MRLLVLWEVQQWWDNRWVSKGTCWWSLVSGEANLSFHSFLSRCAFHMMPHVMRCELTEWTAEETTYCVILLFTVSQRLLCIRFLFHTVGIIMIGVKLSCMHYDFALWCRMIQSWEWLHSLQTLLLYTCFESVDDYFRMKTLPRLSVFLFMVEKCVSVVPRVCESMGEAVEAEEIEATATAADSLSEVSCPCWGNDDEAASDCTT